MLEALLWSAGIGSAARFLLSGKKPGPLITLTAGTGGCLLGFLVGHELLRMHEFHLFEPESLIPATLSSVVLLLLARASLGGPRDRSLFS